MRSKIIYSAFMVSVLIGSLLLSNIKVSDQNKRIHQHLEKEEGLPTIEITTNGQEIPGSPVVAYDEKGHIQVIKADTAEELGIECSFLLEDAEGKSASQALIKYRGNASRFFNKKSYSLHLTEENGSENSLALAGMAEHNEWVLNGPYLDRTMIRNYLCMNISGEIMDYAPNVRFCEVVVDGEYQGLYLLMESITKGNGRLDLTKPDKHARVTSYVVHLDRSEKATRGVETFGYYTYETGESVFEVKYPGVTLASEERLSYITEDISKLEKLLYSYDIESDTIKYTDYIDLEEFAKYFVINEFFGNHDAGFYSTYLYKDVRGKLKPCVWDFNNACDNYMDYASAINSFTMINAPWFERLITQEEFVEAVIASYKELRKGVLSEEYLQNYIDETVVWLSDAVDKNYEKWDEVWEPESKGWFEQEMQYLSPIDRNLHSYDEAVEQLKDYITERGAWLDENIDTLKQYCHDSRNAMDKLR